MTKRLIVICLATLLTACNGKVTGYAGMDMGLPKSSPKYDMDNPIGRFGVRYTTEADTEIYCEHLSSIPDTDDGYGLNRCGAAILFDLGEL